MKTTKTAAMEMLALGIYPVPIKPGTKKPIGEEWEKLRLVVDDLQEYFNNGQQIGILLGIAPPTLPDGLPTTAIGDIDVDCAEALALTRIIQPPPTQRIFGHRSKPASHFLYRVPQTDFKGKRYSDTAINPNKGKPDTLIELRGAGMQTVTPPSLHPSGEKIEWDCEAEFGVASHEELLEYVALIASASLLARHWPTAPRHEARWALSGALLRNGWPEEKILAFVTAVVSVAQPGDSSAVDKIEGDLERARELRANGDNTIGLPRLAELAGADVVKAICKWLALHRSQGGTSNDASGMILTEGGGLRPLLANAITILQTAPVWKGVLGFDEFNLHTVARKSPPWPKPEGSNWGNLDDIRMAEWLQHNGVLVGSQIAADAAQVVAESSPFHPVKEYLDALKWDGVERLNTWLHIYLGANDYAFTREIGSRWMISAVARIYEPGCRADHTLLLEGPQGIEKSTALRTLASDAWFTDHLSDLDNKDSRLQLHGKWIVELAELASFRRSAAEKVKSFLTARFDNYRPPYGRRTVDVPRSNVFAGSVNDMTPFSDETGNRRFWPVRCGLVDIEKLKGNRDQLWAEALERYRKNEPWWLDTTKLNEQAATEQEQRYEVGVWDEVILAWLESPTQREEWDNEFSTTHPLLRFRSTVFQKSRRNGAPIARTAEAPQVISI